VAGLSKRERRSHFRGKPRPGRRVEVSFTTDDGTRERAHTRNIGVGGAFVVTPRPGRPGSVVRLAVHIPSATDPLQVSGEIRWIDSQGMGIRFDGLDIEAVLALNEYFASLTGKDEA
jgi:Tfp pilus assembly protein PilZ